MHRIYQAQIDFAVMKRHVDVALKGLELELRDLESVMENELYELKEHQQDAYFSNVNDYWIETAEVLPLLQWHSHLLISYGYFEKVLNDLCADMKKTNEFSLSLKDLHGQGISRARNYLTKVANVEAPFLSKDWASISCLGDLRNVIAHRGGFVDYEPNLPSSLSCRLSNIEGIELRQETMNQHDAQVVFGHGLIIMALETFSRFCGELGVACQAANNSFKPTPHRGSGHVPTLR